MEAPDDDTSLPESLYELVMKLFLGVLHSGDIFKMLSRIASLGISSNLLTSRSISISCLTSPNLEADALEIFLGEVYFYCCYAILVGWIMRY